MANPSPVSRPKPYVVEPSPAGDEIQELHIAQQGWTPFLGRVLYSSLFILASFGHFTQAEIAYGAQQGVPYAQYLVPLAGIIALVGGLSVLVGYRARGGAALLLLFLIPVTLVMHQFWNITDPAAQGIQQAMFFKNVALMGGALYILHYGAGAVSFDSRRRGSIRV